MKPLSLCVAIFSLLTLIVAAITKDISIAVLGVVAALSAFTTFRSSAISSFLKIFVLIFSTETIVFGLAVLAVRADLWPETYAEYRLHNSLPLTVAIFSIVVYLMAQSPTVQKIMHIADRYFDASETAPAR